MTFGLVSYTSKNGKLKAGQFVWGPVILGDWRFFQAPGFRRMMSYSVYPMDLFWYVTWFPFHHRRLQPGTESAAWHERGELP